MADGGSMDPLLHDLKFENDQYAQAIEKELQIIADWEKRVEDDKQAIRHDIEISDQHDEDAKLLQQQYLQNIRNIESVRETCAVLADQESVLEQRLEQVKQKGHETKGNHSAMLERYNVTCVENEKKYESMSSTLVLRRQQTETENRRNLLSAMLSELANVRQRIDDLNRRKAKYDEFPVFEAVNDFCIRIAELGVSTARLYSEINSKTTECENLEKLIRERIEARRQQEEAARQVAERELAKVRHEEEQQRAAAARQQQIQHDMEKLMIAWKGTSTPKIFLPVPTSENFGASSTSSSLMAHSSRAATVTTAAAATAMATTTALNPITSRPQRYSLLPQLYMPTITLPLRPSWTAPPREQLVSMPLQSPAASELSQFPKTTHGSSPNVPPVVQSSAQKPQTATEVHRLNITDPPLLKPFIPKAVLSGGNFPRFELRNPIEKPSVLSTAVDSLANALSGTTLSTAVSCSKPSSFQNAAVMAPTTGIVESASVVTVSAAVSSACAVTCEPPAPATISSHTLISADPAASAVDMVTVTIKSTQKLPVSSSESMAWETSSALPPENESEDLVAEVTELVVDKTLPATATTVAACESDQPSVQYVRRTQCRSTAMDVDDVEPADPLSQAVPTVTPYRPDHFMSFDLNAHLAEMKALAKSPGIMLYTGRRMFTLQDHNQSATDATSVNSDAADVDPQPMAEECFDNDNPPASEFVRNVSAAQAKPTECAFNLFRSEAFTSEQETNVGAKGDGPTALFSYNLDASSDLDKTNDNLFSFGFGNESFDRGDNTAPAASLFSFGDFEPAGAEKLSELFAFGGFTSPREADCSATDGSGFGMLFGGGGSGDPNQSDTATDDNAFHLF